MKRISHRRLAGAVVVLLALGGARALSSGQTIAAEHGRNPPPEIVVHGTGEVTAAPDQATVSLGAEAQTPDAAAAQSAVNASIENALANILKLGIPAHSIQTTSISLTPIYAPPQPGKETEPPRIAAYRASDTLQIRVTNLSLVGRVIDAAMAGGANRLEGVAFSLRNDLPQRTAALRSAVEQARAKAQTIADALGVKITGVAGAVEGGVNVIEPRQPYGLALRSMAAAVTTPVEPGQVRVQATVTLRFRIAPGEKATDR